MSTSEIEKINIDGVRLESLIHATGLSQKDFAEKIEYSPGLITKIKKGESSLTSRLKNSIFTVFGVNSTWWETGEGDVFMPDFVLKKSDGTVIYGEAKTPKSNDSYIHVPRYEIAAAAGAGAVVQSEQIVDHLSFKSSWLKDQLGLSPASVAVISVFGDSMEPYLADGDLILIDTSIDRVKNDSVYVLQYGDSLLVKRIQTKRDGTVIVKSDNDRYEPETFRGDSVAQLRVVGRLVRRLVR